MVPIFLSLLAAAPSPAVNIQAEPGQITEMNEPYARASVYRKHGIIAGDVLGAATSAHGGLGQVRLRQVANVHAAPTRPANPPASGLVYLECTIQQHWAVDGDVKTVHWQITLNEAAGTVDYNALSTGDQRVAARFTQDKVFFIGFELSRIDLTIHREFSNEVETGTCRIATPQPRAF